MFISFYLFDYFLYAQSLRAAKKVKLGSKEICIAKIPIDSLETQLLVTTWIVKKPYTNWVS